jgi:hypothetical protein
MRHRDHHTNVLAGLAAVTGGAGGVEAEMKRTLRWSPAGS